MVPDTSAEPSGPVLLVAGEPPVEVILDASQGHEALLHCSDQKELRFVQIRRSEGIF